MLEELLSEFFLPPVRALRIGDTTHDLQMASNASMSALAVAYGAHPADLLDSMSPLARLHSVKELGEWLYQYA